MAKSYLGSLAVGGMPGKTHSPLPPPPRAGDSTACLRVAVGAHVVRGCV